MGDCFTIALMEIWQAALLGLVQGVTEFLPISSSGHLFLGEYFLGLQPHTDFMIALHVATLLAVILVYFDRILSLLKAWGQWWLEPKAKNLEAILGWQLIVATLVTVVVALIIEPYFETILNLKTVAITLMLTGLLIMLSEFLACRSKNQVLNWRHTLGLGLVQGLAVIPGISRSGITIAYLLSIGIDRRQAADISFLLSMPTILGAGVFMLKSNDWQLTLDVAQWIGCGVAFLAAIVAIFWMKSWVQDKWLYFAPYCIGLSLILFFVLL